VAVVFNFISNTLEEFLDKFEKTPAALQTYLSTGALLGTAERHPALINKCELFSCSFALSGRSASKFLHSE